MEKSANNTNAILIDKGAIIILIVENKIVDERKKSHNDRGTESFGWETNNLISATTWALKEALSKF